MVKIMEHVPYEKMDDLGEKKQFLETPIFILLLVVQCHDDRLGVVGKAANKPKISGAYEECQLSVGWSAICPVLLSLVLSSQQKMLLSNIEHRTPAGLKTRINSRGLQLKTI